mgnify:CR=1 FL=1
MNTTSTPDLFHSAFYKFVKLDEPDAVIEHLRKLTSDLLGSILVAQEGINGMVAGSTRDVDAFEAALQADPRIGKVTFKRSACITVPFKRMKVRRKNEIVPLGIPGVDATRGGGIDVSPAEWRKLIAEDDVVLLDNRNSFEYKVGHFEGAIDPQVHHFRDFPEYVKAHMDEWKAEGKRVAMYCTGGIRCDKTSAWMADLGMSVYQLEGGILNYFMKMPDAEKDWHGECFVFDNRIALDTKMRETDTTLEDVYDGEPDGEWRLARAKTLSDA